MKIKIQWGGKEADELDEKMLLEKSGCQRILSEKEMQEYVRIADELIGKFAKEGARYIDVGSRLINDEGTNSHLLID